MSTRFIHIVPCVKIFSFLEEYSIVYVYHSLLIHWTYLLNILILEHWVASTFKLWIILLWTWVYKCLFETLLSILLDIYPEGVLLPHRILNFGRTFILSTAAAAQFYTPMANLRDFISSPTLVFSVAILMGVKWYFIVILIYTSLIVVLSIFSYAVWPILSLWRNVFSLLPI